MTKPARNAPPRVIVIGAGPAGLALGHELGLRGVPFQILERGAVGESWCRMPADMTLVSPWKASRLPGESLRAWRANREVTRVEFHRYLCDYAQSASLPVRCGIEVLRIHRDAANRFVLQTSTGQLHCDVLVNATGYFQNPYIPAFPGRDETPIAQFHVAECGDATALRNRLGDGPATVLVVGKRLSAGQLIPALVDGGFTVVLSHRMPIQFGAGRLGWWLFFRVHPYIEMLKLRLGGARAKGFDVRMPGGRPRRLIEGGRVRTVPSIDRFTGDGILLTNGETIRPDAVIYATGYRPALAHLGGLRIRIDPGNGLPETSGMEGVGEPGLFFLGLDHLRNFQSRFLRGIRNDAAELAAQLTRRLQIH